MPAGRSSPLAEGRELKFARATRKRDNIESPLAEGRELKSPLPQRMILLRSRPSRRGVN